MGRISRWTRWSAARVKLALLMAALIGFATQASAYQLAGIGGRLGSLDPEGADGTLGVGASLEFEQSGSQVHLQPNVIYWSENGLSDVNPNFDISYHFAPTGSVSPYLGAGFGLHFYGSDGPGDPGTDPGANFFGGVVLPTRTVSLFFEGRVAATDRDQFGLFTGLTFPVR